MSLEDLKDQIARQAHAVQDFAERLKENMDNTRRRHRLDHELDVLFTELGIEVYQRMRADEPVESSVTVQDLVDRLADVEMRLATDDGPATEPTAQDA